MRALSQSTQTGTITPCRIPCMRRISLCRCQPRNPWYIHNVQTSGVHLLQAVEVQYIAPWLVHIYTYTQEFTLNHRQIRIQRTPSTCLVRVKATPVFPCAVCSCWWVFYMYVLWAGMGIEGAQPYTVIASDIILFLYKFSINCNHERIEGYREPIPVRV